MWAMPPFRTILSILVLMLASCAPSRPMPVLIEVADATTGAPVEGVIIHAAGGTFYVPTMQSSVIGAPGTSFGPPPEPAAAVGETNQAGRSHLTIAGQRPVFLRFFKDGYQNGQLVIETGESRVLGATTWTTGETIAAMEQHLTPGSSATGEVPLAHLMYRVSANPAKPD